MKRIVNSDWFVVNLGFLVGVLGVGSEAYNGFVCFNALFAIVALTVSALVDLAPLDPPGHGVFCRTDRIGV